jgi:hypothetical protein
MSPQNWRTLNLVFFLRGLPHHTGEFDIPGPGRVMPWPELAASRPRCIPGHILVK